MVRTTKKVKDDGMQVGSSVYFIDAEDPSFALYEGKIDKVNDDDTFVVTVVNKGKTACKDPVTRIIDKTRLKPSKK